MENFSLLCYFLGIEVSYSSREYLCSQQKYISYILVSATISGPHVSYSPSLSVIKAKFDDSSRRWGSFTTTHRLEKMCCCPYLFATHPDIFLMRCMYGVSLLVVIHRHIMWLSSVSSAIFSHHDFVPTLPFRFTHLLFEFI